MLHKALHRISPLALALAFPALALGAVDPQVAIAGSQIPMFKQALPLLNVQPGGTMTTIIANNTSFASPLQLSMCEFQAKVLPPGTFAAGVQPLTWVWGYIQGPTCPSGPVDTYLGPVLVNARGVPTTVKYTNQLPTVDLTKVLAYKFSTDQTIHWADPLGGEMNMCAHMMGQPPQALTGYPAYHSDCSLNFGEFIDANGNSQFNAVGIPAVPHLHGGEVPPVLDGGPDAWFTSFFNVGGVPTTLKGHDYYSNPQVATAANEAAYSYPNSQAPAPLWFHDHTLGATRLNVYAGIAGAYYLVEPGDIPGSTLNTYLKSINMRSVAEVVPIVLQDRMFDTNGQLFFPNSFPGGINGPPTNPQHPYWNPEFIGDTIVINGKAWPYMNVEPRRYRFLFLNGSNARTYEMFFVNPATKVMGPVMWAIGNDGGFLDWASIIDPNAAKPTEPHLIIMPGERYEVIVDFTNFAGQNLIIKNIAKAPFPGGATPQGTTTGMLMQFRVSATHVADTTYDPAANQPNMPGAMPLRPDALVRLTTAGAINITPSKIRQLTLNEVALPAQTVIDPVTGLLTTYPGGPVEILVNNTLWSGDSPRAHGDFTPVTVGGITEGISEIPQEGDVELWEIVNTTMDAHPIHTHLTTFQILNRQGYDTKGFTAAYAAAFPGVPNSTACPPGVYCPAFGPPLNYAPSTASGGKWGGNPDITPFLKNAIQLPDPDEVGWKDTFLVLPGTVNRFLVRYSPTDTALGAVAGYPFSPNDGTPTATDPLGLQTTHGYVWHCHIIDHEDNEMMRPYVVAPLAGATRTYVKGVNY